MCKYHIVCATKYRRKIFYNRYQESIREILNALYNHKGIKIIECRLIPARVHMLVNILLKINLSSFKGYLKGKSVLIIFDKHANLKYKFGNRHFGQKGIMLARWG